LLPLLH